MIIIHLVNIKAGIQINMRCILFYFIQNNLLSKTEATELLEILLEEVPLDEQKKC